MARGINKWYGIGNLTADPETRFSADGKAVANVTVACNDSYKNKNGEQVDNTEFVRVVFFQKLAEIVGQYLKKGSKVYVEGKMRTRKWDDQQGVTRYTTEILANDVQFLDSKPQGQTQPASQQPSQGQQAIDDYDDDIPFR